MKWTEVEEAHYHYCITPIGRFEIVENYGDFVIYQDSIRISAEKDLKTAKEEAKIHLLKTYYSLKIYLEINE